jgi:hypothetical protein
MKDKKKILGYFLLGIGSIGTLILVLFYGVVLFSEKFTSLQSVHTSLRLIFSLPTGLLMMYSTFVIVGIPLLFSFVYGGLLVTGKHYMSVTYKYVLASVWVIAVIVGFLTLFFELDRMVSRVEPFSTDPLMFDITDDIPLSVQYAFKSTLKNEVNRISGTPREGYLPSHFLKIFPGLSETDFEGVEASIGFYTVREGVLVHKLDNTKLVHENALAITDRGLDRLLINVVVRLGINFKDEGTLTKVMDALSRVPSTSEPSPTIPVVEGIACPADALLCPDGSSVGRIGKNCEFAPCPVVEPTPSPVSKHQCTEGERGSFCTKEYRPVCALVEVQCVTTPCPPVAQTYGNGCSACADEKVLSYAEGVCM